jgi:hypothetical protein
MSLHERLKSISVYFFSEYIKKNYNDSVWISGFFGSGKSHLLKMLSLVLENKIVGENKCGEIFAAKIKDDFLS